MAGTLPTITFGGIGSGMDVEGIITGLVNANKTTLTALTTKSQGLKSAASTLSSVGTTLGNLKTAADALKGLTDVASFTAASSNAAAIVGTAAGNAQPGTYAIQVNSLAVEQRTYSGAFASSSASLGQSGFLTLGVGSSTAQISVNGSDSLAGIATKINGAGLRVAASVFYDGSQYRLQVRGLDTGAANAVTFNENGTALDLNGDGTNPNGGKTVQKATDASITIDGFTVKQPTNQIVGVIPGVTLAVAQTTTTPVNVTVASDPTSLSNKINAVVGAYNAAINSIHSIAGYGSTKPQVAQLAGDSALRTITTELSQTMSAAQLGQGMVATLAQLGLQQTRDGTLQFDSTKLATALTQDPTSVEKLLGRATGATTGGAMANLSDIVNSITDSVNGVLTLRSKSLTDQAKKLDDQATQEQTRLDDYTTKLRTQFSAMDTAVAANNSLITQLQKI
jgi:flagellar hook-associated protein 2